MNKLVSPTLLDHNVIDLCVERRARLAKEIRAISGTGVFILATAAEKLRNRDSEFPYRHDSDFFYLTGFEEPDATLVMVIEKNTFSTHLFCRPKDAEREIWDGIRLGPQEATTALKVDKAYSNLEIDQQIPLFLANQTAIYIRLASDAQTDRQIRHWVSQVRQQARSGISSPDLFHDAEKLIHEMRLFKSAEEIQTMRAAALISANAHIRAMRVCKPGMREYQLEAELLHEFRWHGSQSVAYNSIVAAGANACILHYRAGSAELKAGDLCLIDAGCELNGYASDITRTFPVLGRFNPAQKALYAITVAAQEAAIKATKPGNHFMAPHEAAIQILTQGLIDEKLISLSAVGSLDNAIETAAYKRFYMHRTSHWLGMDVHDVGSYRTAGNSVDSHTTEKPWRKLEKNMVITIEPGLYIRPAEDIPEHFWNIGIRIEDDAVLTDNGCELISRHVPVDPDAIEALMNS